MTTEEFQNGAAVLRQQLMGVAQHYLHDTSEAEDVVQDTMLKLWLMRARLTVPAGGMAAVVVRNLCIDRLRRRHPTVDIARLCDAEDVSDGGEQIERMMQAIDSLPSAQRTILTMRHLQGMEMREIALVLGSTEVAVRKMLSRARMTLRRRMLALMATACVLAAVGVTAVHVLEQGRGDECVTYVYGRKYTDEATVLQEMRRTVGAVAEENPQDEIENQLNDLFSE